MRKNLYLYTATAALGGLLFGFDTAVINGAMPFFTRCFELTETKEHFPEVLENVMLNK